MLTFTDGSIRGGAGVVLLLLDICGVLLELMELLCINGRRRVLGRCGCLTEGRHGSCGAGRVRCCSGDRVYMSATGAVSSYSNIYLSVFAAARRGACRGGTSANPVEYRRPDSPAQLRPPVIRVYTSPVISASDHVPAAVASTTRPIR